MRETMFIDSTEIDKLAKGLEERGIKFERRQLYSGYQIVADGWDAVCHEYSYGHESGLLEVMGRKVMDPHMLDSVEGYLKAGTILQRLDKQREE